MGITLNRLYSEVGSTPYSVRLDYDGSNNLIYIGLATPSSSNDSASWRICKLYYNTNNDISGMRYASGSTLFTYKWSNRTTLSYWG